MSNADDSTKICHIGAGVYAQPWYTTLCGESVNGGDSACCAHGDVCMENSICHFTHTQANTSGYYVAGCTDASHSSPACSSRCYAPDSKPFRATSDIVFAPATNLWACCSAAGCGSPTDETFQAPAPEDLKTLSTTSASSTASSSTASTTGASSAPPVVTTTPSASSSTTNVTQENTAPQNAPRVSGLSGGAKAGIAVGAVIGGLALIALAVFLFRRRRRVIEPGYPVKEEIGRDAYSGPMQELGANHDVELDSRTRAELGSGEGVKAHDGKGREGGGQLAEMGVHF
ncbi:MAG: hypothetical protein Q9202_003658 [Teloschistes flavicans]